MDSEVGDGTSLRISDFGLIQAIYNFDPRQRDLNELYYARIININSSVEINYTIRAEHSFLLYLRESYIFYRRITGK